MTIEKTLWTLVKDEDALKLTAGKLGVTLWRMNSFGGGWKTMENHIVETPEEVKEFYTNPEVGYTERISNIY